MAIGSRDALVAAIANGRSASFMKPSITSVVGGFTGLWRASGAPTGNTTLPATTGAALSRTSQGALATPAGASPLITYLTSLQAAATAQGVVFVADRLVEFGGLSGTTTTAQTVSAVSLPSRASSATDVELWLEVMTAVGATASATVTCSYTNSAGTSGRTATLVGGIPASGNTVNRMYQFSLQAGDTGVKSVESFTSTTSTGTAGSLGLVLRRTLVQAPIAAANLTSALDWADCGLEQIPDEAALELYVLAGTTGTGNLSGALSVAQG